MKLRKNNRKKIKRSKKKYIKRFMYFSDFEKKITYLKISKKKRKRKC